MSKYQDFISAVTDTPPSDSWKKFRHQFNRYKDIVLDIKNNGDKFDKEKWELMFNLYNNVEPIVLAMCENKHCPNAIINCIIQNTEINKSGHNMHPKAIVHSILKRDNLSDKQIEKIVENYSFDVIYQFATSYHKDKDIVYDRPFSEDITNRVIKSIYEHEGAGIQKTLLLSLSDKSLIDRIVRENIFNETFRDVLVNNIHLTDDERNQVFDFGCDRTQINNPTSYMLENMYRESVEAYFENDYKSVPDLNERKVLENAYYKSFSFLQYMIRNKMLTEDMQVDLMHRLAGLKEKSQNAVLAELLKWTENEQVFKIAESSIISRDKEYIYSNKSCPHDILYRKSFELIKKIDRAIRNGKPISDNWTRLLGEMINRLNLSIEYEDLLLQVRDKSLHKPLACAPYTSIETLETIEKDRNVDSLINMFAGVNKALFKAEIDSNKLTEYMYFLGFRLHISMVGIGFNTSLVKVKHFENFILENLKTSQKVVDALNEYKNRLSDIKAYDYLNYYIKSIEYIILREKEFDGSSYEKTNREKLMDMQDEMSDYIRKYCNSYEAILQICENADKFNEIRTILINQKGDKIKEEIEKEEER